MPQQDGRRQRIYKVIAALAGILFFVYVAKGILLYEYQRRFLYIPPGRPLVVPDKDITVAHPATADGLQLTAWFAPPKGRKPVVVSFHGNGDDLNSAALVLPYFRSHGYGVFLCEYRGYSGNPGEPTEDGLYLDGRACINWLKDHGYVPDKLVFQGHSLGTGVAVQMASEFQPKALVLESAFTSVVDAAQPKFPLYPANIIVRDRFDSLSKIGKVKSRLLMVHGTLDGMVSIELGQKLFAAANEPKTFIVIRDGGHNDLYAHKAGEMVADWLDKQVGQGG